MQNVESIPQQVIENKIFIIRGKKVMFAAANLPWAWLDRDLAMLYGVETKALNQAVRRNIVRFPDDFMFQLTKEVYQRPFKVTNCDLKKRATFQIFALCLHGKWSSDAIKRLK
jgi:hypothetical protein